ncbi:hypothetical protein [Pseudomonas sp.]|uniref:hypothetical protein n=1 Tax=Pseudomonas sp. TaxID=306 RepID=UPI002911CC54|nr:hypothetical protein [Pseudomonas sp.]MDU4254467.1 hypothetical protein [Pseudomonas sp.]
MATKDQADKLLKRLMKDASILSAEKYPLDNTKSVCLLEVELLADAQKPETRGFVYVTPDGEHFLNGPLMDKRSKIGLEPSGADIKEALAVNGEMIKKAMAGQPQNINPVEGEPMGLMPPSPGALAGFTEPPASPENIPSPAQLREMLIQKLQVLPGIVSPAPGKPVYVLVDPLCSKCKLLFKTSSEIAAQKGIQFHWIPMITSEGSWALSALALKAQREDPENAMAVMEKIMTGQLNLTNSADAIKGLTEADYAAPKDATAVFIELAKYNSRLGTPLVVFRKGDSTIDVINGVPNPEDWEGI